MLNPKLKREKRFRHHKRVRVKISGTSKIPRLCVFKSAKHIYCQLIDDEKGRTLAAAGDLKLNLKPESPSSKVSKEEKTEETKKSLRGKVALAYEVGKLIAKKALDYNPPAALKGKKYKIEKVVFDRGGYRYLGRVRALAEGAREGGLKF